jgi:hypothetical protein
MKHEQLMYAIGDAAVDEIKHLLAPLVAGELARQRAGGDIHAPPALPSLTRAPDRAHIRTRVEWSAAAQLKVLTEITEAAAAAMADRVTNLVRETLLAERIADGSAQREFDAAVAEAQRILAAQSEARARLAKIKDVDACLAAASARAAVRDLIAGMRAKRLAREHRGRAA